MTIECWKAPMSEFCPYPCLSESEYFNINERRELKQEIHCATENLYQQYTLILCFLWNRDTASNSPVVHQLIDCTILQIVDRYCA